MTCSENFLFLKHWAIVSTREASMIGRLASLFLTEADAVGRPLAEEVGRTCWVCKTTPGEEGTMLHLVSKALSELSLHAGDEEAFEAPA